VAFAARLAKRLNKFRAKCHRRKNLAFFIGAGGGYGESLATAEADAIERLFEEPSE
jgi:hypothetical protein